MRVYALALVGCALFVVATNSNPLRVVVSGATGVVVSGTVSGSDTGALSGASVEVDGPTHGATKTNAEGRFTLSDVPRGRYKIRIAADEYLPIERDMDVGDAAVTMDVVLLHLPGLP